MAVSMTLFQLGHRTETTSSQTDCIEIGSRFLLFLGGGGVSLNGERVQQYCPPLCFFLFSKVHSCA